MSLPKYLPLLAFALVWLWLRLHRANERLARILTQIEADTGTWRVQEPTDWPPLSHTAAMTDEEFAEMVESWRRGAA